MTVSQYERAQPRTFGPRLLTFTGGEARGTSTARRRRTRGMLARAVPRRSRLLASSAAARGVQAPVAVAWYSIASARRAQPKGSGHLTFAQHKPYSFLSPSGNPRRSALFAIDLLTSKNAQKKSDFRLCQASGDPCALPGLACAGRLDADSTGLMLWSTDKRFIERIIGPSSRVEKECAPGPSRAERAPAATLSRARVQIWCE